MFDRPVRVFAVLFVLVGVVCAQAAEKEEGRLVEDVVVWAERAQEFVIDDFTEKRALAMTDIDRVAHVKDLAIERDTSTIHLLEGYVFLQEPVSGRPWEARYAGVGRLVVEPPIPVEKRNLEKYWGEQTLDDKFDDADFRFADDEILAFFEDLDYRPTEEVEEEVKKAQEESKDEEGDDEGDAWTDPVKRARKARSLFLAKLDALRKGREAREKEPLEGEDLQRKINSDRMSAMDEARKAFYGDSYQGFWEADMRRVVPEEQKGPGKVYVTGFEYVESPQGGPLGSEEIYLLLKTNFGSNGYTQLACAYHYKDLYDPAYLYTATSEEIDALDHNEVRVTGVKVRATLKGDRIAARSVFRIEAVQDNVQMIALELLPTLDLDFLGWVPPGGTVEDAVPLQVSRPAQVGYLEAWVGDFNTLLPLPMKKGEEVTLVATYEGQVIEERESGFYVVFGKFGWIPDRSLSAMTLDTVIWADPSRTITATGNPVPCDPDMEKPGLKCNRWVVAPPYPKVRFATFNVADDVKIDTTQTEDKKPIRALAHKRVQRRYCYQDQSGHPWCKDYNLSKSTEMIKSVASFSLQLYEQMFGKYPYEKLELVPWEQGGAQSPATLITLSYDAYLSPTALKEIETAILDQIQRSQRPARVRFQDPWLWTEIVSHEVSHQWWGHILFWNSYRDQWLSEGFADFSSAYFMEHYDRANGTDYAQKEWRNRIELLVRDDQKGETIGPVGIGFRMNSPLNPRGFSGWYGVKVYRKGAFTLQMLRHIYRALAWQKSMADPTDDLRPEDSVDLGDKLFFDMMRDFVETYRNGSVSNLMFQKMAEKHLGGELGWFFDQWLYRDGVPDIKWAYEWVPEGGKYALKGRIIQTNTDFQFPITVSVKWGKGKKADSTFFYRMVDSKDYEFKTPAVFDRPASEVTLNEDVMLLAVIEQPEDSVAALAAK